MALPTEPLGVVGTRQDEAVLVSFSPPTDDGGSPITLYEVTANPGPAIATGANSPILVEGLVNGQAYTFTVTATNGEGEGPSSAASAAVTPASVPDPPTVTSVDPGDGQVTVYFTAPVDTGGLAIESYKATAEDTIVPANGGQNISGAASPLVVTGLTNGDAYTFTVTATNDVGESDPSAPSDLVIPEAAAPPPAPDPLPDAVAYPVTKVINLTQFNDELADAAGVPVNTVWEGDTEGGATGTLWVAPSSIPGATIEGVITAHVPDPTYDTNEQDEAYGAVLQKVIEDPDVVLTSDEIQTAVKGLIMRQYNLSLTNV